MEGIHSKYNNVPFHNFKHGLSVAHISFYFLTCTDAGSLLSSIQAFALVMSALCHDLDHPGHTNAFEVNSGSERALIYNDTSVLENHHCATASRMLRREECNILASLDKDEYKEFRSIMCRVILATDMSTHFALLSKFREAVHSAGGWSPQQQSEKQLLLSTLLHAADLSNSTRSWDISQDWAALVSAEFNAQVKMEKEMGLPFLPFMITDSDESRAKQEMNFIDFIIVPMWKDVVEFLPELGFCLKNASDNRNNWKNLSVYTPSSSSGRPTSAQSSVSNGSRGVGSRPTSRENWAKSPPASPSRSAGSPGSVGN